jgi:perosamine synthetase
VDGGMLVCKNSVDLPRGRRVRWFGIDRAEPRIEVDVREVGYKYHMNDVTATIGLGQLEGIRAVLQRHIDNGQFLDRELRHLPGVEICRHDPDAAPAYWMYTVLADRRDDLARRLTEAGVDCSQVHRRNDEHSVFAESRAHLPGLDCFSKRMLHIPCGWWVTDEQREYIVACIKSGW